jgi:hypothetical protein
MAILNYYFKYIPVTVFLIAICGGLNPTFAQEQKYHPLESYEVKYKIEGNSMGQKTEYSGDWGRTLCWVEVSEAKLPEGDPIKINEKVITKIENGEQWIVQINLTDNTGTKVKNPMFPEIYKRIKGKDPKVFTTEFMKNAGAKKVGEMTVAGEKCSEWEIGKGAKTCLTDDMIRVESSLVLENLSVTETAVEIKRNVPNPPDICSTGSAVITETDISKKSNEEIKVE